MKGEVESNDSSELSAVIGALLDSLDDKNQDVRKSVIESIERISKKNPEVVINAAIYFWEMHRKISTEHIASLLNVISGVCRHSAASLNTDLATSLAEVAVNELIGETENEAAELLIELCKIYCIQAMGGLLSKLEPGIIPNAAIVSTIGKLAAANPCGMLSFVKIILTIMLPMLSQIREEVLKQAVCFMLSKFCEAINDCVMNALVPIQEINKHMFEEEIRSACDFIIHNWLKTSRDFKSIEAILTALVFIMPLLCRCFEQEDNERVTKLIPICLSLSKKPNIRLAAVKVLAVLLNCIKTESDKEAIRPSIEYIHQTLFEYVSIKVCHANIPRDTLLTHYEVLLCSKLLVVLYPEEGLDRILQQLKSPITNQRARALTVLKYLINSLPEDDGTLQRIALSLQESLGEDNTLQMVSCIAALAARPTFPLLPSQRAKFIRYMVLHCEAKNDNTKECSTALHLLATTVDGVESWLWPCLIDALLDPSCIASVTSVLRSLSPLAIKIIRNENTLIDERNFPGTKVLGKCLELLSDPANRIAIVTFLRSAAPLIGHRVKPYWDEKLECLQEFLQDEQKSPKEMTDITQRELTWEKEIVRWLEESVKLEGESWGGKLADELVSKADAPSVALLLACTCNNFSHISFLIELARSRGTTKEFARAVGICAKRHSSIILKLMEEFCIAEDARKVPVKLLGLMKDTKAAATAEAAKAGLLQSYAEIAQRIEPQKLFPMFEKHALPWTVRQLNECKELSTKEAGLSVLEQVANAVHPTRFPESKGLRIKTTALATLLGLLQTSSGYRPLQLYPAVLKAINSLIRIPPELSNEEREIFLSTILDRTIGASSEIIRHLNSEVILQRVMDELAAISSEIVSDSADALAELVDILLPWIQSKSYVERKTTLLVLHTVLQSYHNSLKYTYPGGKLDAAKLVGRIFCWCADDNCRLRPMAVDCLFLSLRIAARHRHISLDNTSIKEKAERAKREVTESEALSYGTVKYLADAVSKKIPCGDIVGFAEGLIESLIFYGEASLIAGIALSRHFEIRGSEISRTDVCLVDTIITQMRQIENRSCRYIATIAVVSMMKHHLEEVCEHLLSQPLPLDPGTMLCWKEIGNKDSLGHRALELLLLKLESSTLFSEATTHSEKNNTASLPSLAAIVALKYLLESPNIENLIEDQLPGLLSILLKYLSGWLRIEAPASLINTKYGYVPNRAVQKMNPYAEVHSVLANILMSIQPNVAYILLPEATSSFEAQTEENVISIIQTMIKCILNKNQILWDMAQDLNKLVTSTIPVQRAVAVAFYTEMINKVEYGVVRLEAVINILHEARTDSSILVRKLAIIGLARIGYLDPRLLDEYFDNCVDALLDGLEETAGGEGGAEVVLESLRGLSIVLSAQYKKPISPRVILALKPFLEKENWEMKLAAIDALGAIATNWQKSVILLNGDDDDLIGYLLGCLPSLIISLEDSNTKVVKITQKTLCTTTAILQNEKLSYAIYSNLGPKTKFDFENFSRDLINCLKEEFPQRAEEFRSSIVRGYSISENYHTRATSALLLGLFSPPTPEDIQRLLQLLRDRNSIVRMRASQALSFCFTL